MIGKQHVGVGVVTQAIARGENEKTMKNKCKQNGKTNAAGKTLTLPSPEGRGGSRPDKKSYKRGEGEFTQRGGNWGRLIGR